MRRHRHRFALVIVALLAAPMSPVSAAPGPFATVGAVAAAAPVRLKVMTFNIEYGGTVIDFDKIVEAAVASHADVIGLNEAYGHVRRLAREAGFDHWNTRLDLVSKYPILDPPDAPSGYVFVQLAPGRVVALTNIHLTSGVYGPRAILDGMSRRKVLRLERATRLQEIEPVVERLAPVVAAGIPTFIIGDMNTPSHEDWTARTVGLRPQVKWPVRWPVTMFLARNGYLDTYRMAHPNPVTDEGLTWPSGRPRSPDSWNPKKDAPEDRIDQIWVTGEARSVQSRVVGERGGDGVGIGVKPWGSDHRAVVSTVLVRPAAPPILVTTDRPLVTKGRDLLATYHAPGDPGEKVVIVPAGGDPATDGVDQAATPAADDIDGTVAFATGAWAPGGYDAVLVDAADNPLSRAEFWVRDAGVPPTLATSAWHFDVGEKIGVSWQGAPGNRFDWIGIYRRGADPNVASYINYLYTGARVAGSVRFGRAANGHWPLHRGRYTAYYLLHDNYRQVASADFVIS